jgi:hypothetical protein
VAEWTLAIVPNLRRFSEVVRRWSHLLGPTELGVDGLSILKKVFVASKVDFAKQAGGLGPAQQIRCEYVAYADA